MEYKIKTLPEFWVVGISIRTNNGEGKAQKDIGNLWGEWFEQSISQKISNKISEDIYCIYTDYVSDYTEDYTTIIGCAVSSVENLPEGLIAKQIKPAEYQEYTYSGKIPDCVAETWGCIWESDIKRAYTADFDVYVSQLSEEGNPVMKTYISI